MFLYLLNENEGKAFMELAAIAMKVDGEKRESEKAEFETYLTELNLEGYQAIGLSFNEVTRAFKFSTTPVKRSVIIELCGLLYVNKEMENIKTNWIYNLSDVFNLDRKEVERLIRWSIDFADFLEVGLMYINANE